MNVNIWKALTISLATLLLVSLIAYLILVDVLPAAGYAFDVPLISNLSRGLFGFIIGVLTMVVLIAVPIIVFVVTAILFGFGFGIGVGITPIGRALIHSRR